MKKTLFYLILSISFAQTLNAQVVNIPDVNFKGALLLNTSIDTNKDKKIQVSEAVAYSDIIYVQSKKIKDLTGIEAFINIKTLYCGFNELTTLDVSKNIALTTLVCNSNQLTTLDISKNIVLTNLDCFNNQLTTLDISKNIALNSLYCSNNQLTTLDINKNIALTKLSCSNNQLTTLDISKNIKVNYFDCNNNQLTSLDVSKNIEINYFDCNNNQLTSLDVSKNIALADFDCSFNKITTLDINKNTTLINLFCSHNQLTTLNLKNENNITLDKLETTNNLQLKCIQVDDPNKIGFYWKKDALATYSANCNVSIYDDIAIVPQFKLYPNPASHTLHIDWEGDTIPVTITLYNSIGATIKSQQLPKQGSINITDLPRGLYFCRINDAKHQLQTTKVVVE